MPPHGASKPEAAFRNYEDDSGRHERVNAFYRDQHTKQTVAFNRQVREDFQRRAPVRMGIWDMLKYLDTIVDDSDPDTDCSQMTHALQTAESLRKLFPGAEHDWLHLTGLIHDLGKVQAVTDPGKGIVGLDQWAVVGDTFPVGCRFSEDCVLYEHFEGNPDASHPQYSTKLGIYEENCGLDNVMMSWGHDEYMYQVCKRSKCLLPEAGLFIIRFHSFYPWHSKDAYTYIADESDRRNLEWIRKFNKHDLYSKAHDLPDTSTLAKYYRPLIEKYFPEDLNW